jgi:hypothetical protein
MEAVARSFNCTAKNNFAYFRKLMRLQMIESWWTLEIANALEDFYDDLVPGKPPRLAIGSGSVQSFSHFSLG